MHNENFVFSPTAETEDLSREIEDILKRDGICRLGVGTFPVTTIRMPDNSMLCGSGKGTILLQLPRGNTETGLRPTVMMGRGCTVTDMTVRGTDNERIYDVPKEDPEILHTGFPFTEFCPGRMVYENANCGIFVEAEAHAHIIPQVATISRVSVECFSGAGIHVRRTGFYSLHSAVVSDVMANFNGAGIFTDEMGEFGVYTNITASMNYIGILNNGGNNKFSNCGLDGNMMGFVIGGGTNTGHGVLANSSLNHNELCAIRVTDCTPGFLFSACLSGHNGSAESESIQLRNTSAVSFNGCWFTGRTLNPLQIRIEKKEGGKGKNVVLFSHCHFLKKPVVKNESDAPIVSDGNIDTNGAEVVVGEE